MGNLTYDQIVKRAGGRRRYNAQRQRAANDRRKRLTIVIANYDGPGKRPPLRALARHFNVAESVICRDLQHISRAFGPFWTIGVALKEGRVWRWLNAPPKKWRKINRP